MISRRSLITAGAATTAAMVTAGACATTSAPPPQGGGSGLTLRWFGNNSWELAAGRIRILVDPWLTRFPTGTYRPGGSDPNTPITVNTALLDTYITSADAIVVTHGHFDHLPDIPHIAARTGATVLGTESHCNLLRALGAPDDQLSTVVGGERITYGDYRIDVIPSVHSLVGKRMRVPFPGTRPGAVPPPPRVISDLVEGGMLAYEIHLGGRSVLALGGANYVERELAGRRPDAVLLPTGGASVPDYVPRLMELLGNPATIFPTHWDDFDQPLEAPAVDTGGLERLRAAVARANPGARFVRLEHRQSHTI